MIFTYSAHGHDLQHTRLIASRSDPCAHHGGRACAQEADHGALVQYWTSRGPGNITYQCRCSLQGDRHRVFHMTAHSLHVPTRNLLARHNAHVPAPKLLNSVLLALLLLIEFLRWFPEEKNTQEVPKIFLEKDTKSSCSGSCSQHFHDQSIGTSLGVLHQPELRVCDKVSNNQTPHAPWITQWP